MNAPLPSLVQDEAVEARPAAPARWVSARLLLGLVLPAGLAIAWEAAVRFGWAQGRLMPPPSRIYATLVELARSGELSIHVQTTLMRVLAGFVIGAVAGTLAGAIAGTSDTARRIFDPTLQALRAVPS